MARKRTVRTARPPRNKRVTFTLDAPEAHAVSVAGTFCDWQTDACALKQNRTGVWKKTRTLPPGRYEYRFVVDGEWRNDPNCTEHVLNAFGADNDVLHV